MTTKHTPGPWTYTVDHSRDRAQIIWDPTNNQGPALILTSGVSGRGREEGMANVHLIAAAPELLEACERWVLAEDTDCLMSDEELFEIDTQMRAAIAKARGNP